DQKGAIQVAETIRGLGWGDPPGNAYHATCSLARCIPIVYKDATLDAGQRRAAVQSYGDGAMAMLRQAVAAGYRDIPRLLADADLAPLRNRADYADLLWDLADSPPAEKGAALDRRSTLPRRP
ncbi:MAG TPA: hypothetical protein VH120_17485, partial [Gemmataceae bacterium]|nr:hypothetical protein [Gemmataceae bacterium]